MFFKNSGRHHHLRTSFTASSSRSGSNSCGGTGDVMDGGISSASLVDLIAHEDWRLAKMEATMNPKEVSEFHNIEGFFDGEHSSIVLPIHQACALQPPVDMISLLHKLYPAGIGITESKFHRLPLHIACQTNASVSVIQTLLQLNIEGARHKDALGRLPIHYACSHGASVHVVKLLLDAFPPSSSVADKNGWLPIHVACRFGDDKEVICALIQSWPDCLHITTNRGNTPLTCAKKVHDERHEILVHLIEQMSQSSSNSSQNKSTTIDEEKYHQQR